MMKLQEFKRFLDLLVLSRQHTKYANVKRNMQRITQSAGNCHRRVFREERTPQQLKKDSVTRKKRRKRKNHILLADSSIYI